MVFFLVVLLVGVWVGICSTITETLMKRKQYSKGESWFVFFWILLSLPYLIGQHIGDVLVAEGTELDRGPFDPH